MSQGVRKGSMYVLIGQGVASVFLFLFQMFAGRWLGVEDYGLLNVLYSTIFIVAVLVVAGVMQGSIRYIAFFLAKEDSEGVRQSVQTSFITYLILLLITLLLSLIFKNLLLEKLFNGNLIILMQYLIGVCVLSIFRFYNGMLQGYRKFHIFSIGIGLKEFVTFGILVLIVKNLGLSAVNAGWSIVISPVIAILFYLFVTKDSRPSIKWEKGDKLNPQIIRFILIGGFISLMNQWVVRAGPILIKILGGNSAFYYAGLFSAIMMPLNLARTVVIALLIGLFPNLSRAYSLKDENLIRRYTLKSAGIVGALIIFIVPVYYFFGPEIVKLIYGEGYTALRSDTTLLAFVIAFFLVGTLLSKIIMARGTPRYSAISFFIGILGLFITLYLVNLSPLKSVGTALLVCNFLYVSVQAIYLIALRLRGSIEKEPHSI